MLKKYLILFFTIFFISSSFTTTILKSENEEVEIGDQIWMLKNLDVITFKNGDDIEEAKSDYDWYMANLNRKPAWCYVWESHPELGKFYNSYAVRDERGLAPDGWHVPTNDEWEILINHLGGETIAFDKLTTKQGWRYPSKSASNTSGFTAMALGSRNGTGQGERINIQSSAEFWSSTKIDGECNRVKIESSRKLTTLDGAECRWGYSVRCIKN